METKSILSSKVFWTNVLIIVALVAGSFGVDVGLDDQTKGEIATGVVAIVNILLRFLTSSSVNLTGK